MKSTDTVKRSQWKSLLKCLDKIENNYTNQSFSIDEDLISTFDYSKKTINRYFKKHLGENIYQYIRRLRLERAKRLLVYTNKDISSIITESGYDNANSFYKAFKSYYNTSPDKFRKDIVKNVFDSNKIYEHHTIELGPLQVIYCRSLGSYNYKKPEIAWANLLEYINKKEIDISNSDYFAIMHDDFTITKTKKLRYDACITVKEKIKKVSDNIGYKIIPKAVYEVFTFKGPYSKLEEIYDYIFFKYINETKRKSYLIPVIEKYLNDPINTKPEDLLTEIYLPIE